ncbi:MAG: hypothetical protein ABGZ35_29210 [Planctomycetaceae bacterium]
MLLIVGVPCLIPAGCSEPPAIQKYVVASENQKNLTSELLRREFPPIPFRWDVPETWNVTSNDQFSVRAWKAGPPEKQARITLGQFPARTGIPAQVMRWRGQVGLKTDSEDAAMQDVQALRTKNGAGSFATVEGEAETILAFILPIETQFWIFRFKGPNSTAESEDDRFRRFCESLQYVAPPGTTLSNNRERNPSLPSPESTPRPESAAPESTREEATSAPPPSIESAGDAHQLPANRQGRENNDGHRSPTGFR